MGLPGDDLCSTVTTCEARDKMKPLAVVLVAIICGLALAQYPSYPGTQARSGSNGGLWGLILCLFLFFFLFNILGGSNNAVTRIVYGNFTNGPVTFSSG